MIIAFVVVVWAAYFIPLALRRYDEASKNASIETSGTLSRVIARRVAAAVPVKVPTQEPAVETAPRSARTPAPSRSIDRPAARLAARRRRRTLIALLALTVVVAGLAGLSVIPAASIVVPVLLIVAWLVACRVQVRGELGITRAKRPAKPAGAAASTASDEEETVIVSGQLEDINPGRKHTMEDVSLEADALDDQIVIAVPSVSTTGEALWDPLPVTLPTYVTKPRAGRTVRTIDFTQAGTWTSGHIEGEDVELPKRSDDSGDHRRAVGH
ncbi:MAG: hypothetical protein JWP31_1558 [Aeromicrobium sp.]|nr:hypothetical protein [Aeromicrobium sp.]